MKLQAATPKQDSRIDDAVEAVLSPFRDRSLLYLHEVAKLLLVTRRHIKDLIDEGHLAGVNVGGGSHKHWRVPLTEVRRFLRSRNSLDCP